MLDSVFVAHCDTEQESYVEHYMRNVVPTPSPLYNGLVNCELVLVGLRNEVLTSNAEVYQRYVRQYGRVTTLQMPKHKGELGGRNIRAENSLLRHSAKLSTPFEHVVHRYMATTVGQPRNDLPFAATATSSYMLEATFQHTALDEMSEPKTIWVRIKTICSHIVV